MRCPRCATSRPQELKPEQYEGVTIDRCPACAGAWLDLGELERINKTIGEQFDPATVASATQTSTGVPLSEQQSQERCPRCHAAMSPVNFNYSSGVVIDSCPARHGLWLDGHELEKIQAHWEHWEKQKKENAGAWALTATGAKQEAMAQYDQARSARRDQMFGVFGRAVDRALHAIEKARRSSG